MRDDICTIPISEAFEEDGCPFCTMKLRITQRLTEYILGPAMMEPDIREMTNRSGFCREHFEGLLQMKNRLSLALTIETYLTHGTGADTSKKAGLQGQGCFICENLERGFSAMINNFFSSYTKDDGIREIFTQSKTICRPHFLRLRQDSRRFLSSKQRKLFETDLNSLYERSLKSVTDGITAFAGSFDYRNAGNTAAVPQKAIEDAIDFIVGRK